MNKVEQAYGLLDSDTSSVGLPARKLPVVSLMTVTVIKILSQKISIIHENKLLSQNAFARTP
jgi:hypothetical protein